jgi:hypothetical protein
MAYMNSGASPAGLPFMLSQAAGNAGSAGLANSNSAVALLNVSNLLSQKDSRWLQLEVCREFQRNKCSRLESYIALGWKGFHIDKRSSLWAHL